MKENANLFHPRMQLPLKFFKDNIDHRLILHHNWSSLSQIAGQRSQNIYCYIKILMEERI